jgi:hypothetical protein
MPVLVKANEAAATRREVEFHLVGPDGVTPATGEAGGQPQVSTNNGAWTNAGIGTLAAIGNGRYSAALTQAAVAAAGDHVYTRYKSANTAECPGESVRVVAFDPYDALLGIAELANLDQSVQVVNDNVQAVGLRVTTALPNTPPGAFGGLPVLVDDGLGNLGVPIDAAAVLAAGDVDGFTLEQTLKLCLAALAGKLSGAAGTTVTIRAADDSKDRIVAIVDGNGNRTAVTLDAAG